MSGRPRNGTPGWVYFAHLPEMGLVKVGWSSRVAVRMVELACDNFTRVILLGSYPGTYADEAREHVLLVEHRVLRKEYFADNEAVMSRAATACTLTPAAKHSNVAVSRSAEQDAAAHVAQPTDRRVQTAR